MGHFSCLFLKFELYSSSSFMYLFFQWSLSLIRVSTCGSTGCFSLKRINSKSSRRSGINSAKSAEISFPYLSSVAAGSVGDKKCL